MAKKIVLPDDLKFCATLTAEEQTLLSAYLDSRTLAAGTVIFREGEAGGCMYIVSNGAAEIATKIVGDVEKTLLTARRGAVFGELSLITGENRTATAKALEPTELLALNADSWHRLLAEEPLIGSKITRELTQILADRLNITTEMYRRAIAWDLDISAVVELNYHQLIIDRQVLTCQLTNGNMHTGVLLKIEKGALGNDFLLRTAAGEFVIIPYQALASISFKEQKGE